MNNSTKLIIALVIVIIAVLVASKYVSGFDAFISDTVLAPTWATIVALGTSVVTSPFWLQYGYYVVFLGGIGTCAFFTLWFWPRVKSKPIGIKTPLQDKIPSKPTRIPNATQSVPLPSAELSSTSNPSSTPTPATEESAEEGST